MAFRLGCAGPLECISQAGPGALVLNAFDVGQLCDGGQLQPETPLRHVHALAVTGVDGFSQRFTSYVLTQMPF